MPYRRDQHFQLTILWLHLSRHTHTHTLYVYLMSPTVFFPLDSLPRALLPLSSLVRLISVMMKNTFFRFSLQTAPTDQFLSHWVNIHWAMCLEMSSPLRPMGGPYIFHVAWHMFDFLSAVDGMSYTWEKKLGEINHARCLKVSYPISQTFKLDATSETKNYILMLTWRLFLALLVKRQILSFF